MFILRTISTEIVSEVEVVRKDGKKVTILVKKNSRERTNGKVRVVRSVSAVQIAGSNFTAMTYDGPQAQQVSLNVRSNVA